MTFVFAVGMPWDATTCNAIPSRISRSHQCLAAMSPTPARPANLTSICWLPPAPPNSVVLPLPKNPADDLRWLPVQEPGNRRAFGKRTQSPAIERMILRRQSNCPVSLLPVETSRAEYDDQTSPIIGAGA